jgi:hypothetical protein
MPFFYVSRVTNLTTPRSAPDLELLLRRSWAVFARQNYSINICQHKFFVSSRNTVKLWWNLLRVLKRANSRACELEINASLLAPPDPCVPGPRAEDARGREALGTRMQLHYKIFRYLKRETKLEVKNYQSKNGLFHCILHDIFCEISIINFPTNGIRLKLRNVFEIVFNRQTPQTSNRQRSFWFYNSIIIAFTPVLKYVKQLLNLCSLAMI